MDVPEDLQKDMFACIGMNYLVQRNIDMMFWDDRFIPRSYDVLKNVNMRITRTCDSIDKYLVEYVEKNYKMEENEESDFEIMKPARDGKLLKLFEG